MRKCKEDKYNKEFKELMKLRHVDLKSLNSSLIDDFLEKINKEKITITIKCLLSEENELYLKDLLSNEYSAKILKNRFDTCIFEYDEINLNAFFNAVIDFFKNSQSKFSNLTKDDIDFIFNNFHIIRANKDIFTSSDKNYKSFCFFRDNLNKIKDKNYKTCFYKLYFQLLINKKEYNKALEDFYNVMKENKIDDNTMLNLRFTPKIRKQFYRELFKELLI